MSLKNREPVYYGDYLNLDSLLSTQRPKSKEFGDESHDETLFIIVHQAYELWFKQILHELDSIVTIFERPPVEERKLSLAVDRLERIIKIQGLLLDQLEVMETMTPMDFLEFRDLLVPASGFQSLQFRKIEVLLGLGTNARSMVDREYFMGRLSEKDQKELIELEERPSLIELMERWLERMPFTQKERFDFWKAYRESVEEMLKSDRDIIEGNTALTPEQRTAQLANLQATEQTFDALFNEEKHKDLRKNGQRRLSQSAILNSLFVLLYRDEPLLNRPFALLNALMDIDENFTTWRYRHSIMAHRMLGTKIGTGGSSGHQYLKRAAETNRVFLDIFDLSTFLIPRSKLPTLPEDLKRDLDFHFTGKK